MGAFQTTEPRSFLAAGVRYFRIDDSLSSKPRDDANASRHRREMMVWYTSFLIYFSLVHDFFCVEPSARVQGEVYQAKDTRLDRDVAIKVLPSHLADNPDLKQRFEREARAVSSLNHPHICTLYEFDTQGQHGLPGHGVPRGRDSGREVDEGCAAARQGTRDLIAICIDPGELNLIAICIDPGDPRDVMSGLRNRADGACRVLELRSRELWVGHRGVEEPLLEDSFGTTGTRVEGAPVVSFFFG